MIEWKQAPLSVRRQSELLSLNRSTLYYESVEASEEELALMWRIDELYLNRPFLGSRRMTLALREQGLDVNRKRVQRLMRKMGLEGLAPGPSTSKPHPEHEKYPYLLRGVEVTRANQVWTTDVTYIPMARGFLYLVVIMDWFSRNVLAWRLSNTLDVRFCVEALEEALDRYGTPSIFNSDQGAQFTAADFTDVLKAHGVQISMDGKGRCMDNIFMERLWRSLKYEEVYLKAYEDGTEAKEGIGRWFKYYCECRPHQGLDNETPVMVYQRSLNERRAA